MNKFLFLFFIILCLRLTLNAQNFTISGEIKEKGTLETLIGVNVYVQSLQKGTQSNTYGFYSITLPKKDSLVLIFSAVGYKKVVKTLNLNQNKIINIELENENILDEITVSAINTKEKISNSVQMSSIELPVSQIKKIPTLLGEKDVLKVLQLMPGVQNGTEGQSGIYVRGGGPDQNLIILDDAMVYNASHLFGFFSTFNGDALKSVELIKGGFPSRYGGRLSSVIEMNMKDGNKEKISVEGGIGLIASRLVIEGPIKLKKGSKPKASFLLAGRRTYLDIVSKPFIAYQNRKLGTNDTGGYFFYDFNAKFNYEISGKDKIYLSSYFGRDKFNIQNKIGNQISENGINWGNATATLRWNHIYNQKLFSNTSMIFSDYQFNIFGSQLAFDSTMNRNVNFNLGYLSSIRDYSIKHDFDWFLNTSHTFKMGGIITFHNFTPEATIIQEQSSNLNFERESKLKSTEAGIYIEDQYQPLPNLKINAGLRLSIYQTQELFTARPEPRVSLAYNPMPNFALKASFAQMNQYLHLLSNTGLGLPTDLWVPATMKVPPQTSTQWAVGLAKDFENLEGLTFTFEAYHKKMNNLISYREGASFFSPSGGNNLQAENNWEEKVTNGNGISYGLEFLLQKKVGKFSGWIGYTWSKTEWQFEELNFGRKFFPKFDRRHDLSLVGIYEISPKITISSTWIYATGNALTIPISEYRVYSSHINRNFGTQGYWYNTVNEYGNKNSFIAEPYHRMDLGLQFHKKKKRHERTWDLSVYNLYSRKNPFFYTVGSNLQSNFFGPSPVQTEGNKLVLKRYSLFPIIPSITYNFKF
jgi:outer membrane receptor for ferrienterochelin and colicin